MAIHRDTERRRRKLTWCDARAEHPRPALGDHLHVVGTHVYDTNHGRDEIHPVLTWNGASYPPVVPPLFSGRFPNVPGPFALSEEELNTQIRRSANP